MPGSTSAVAVPNGSASSNGATGSSGQHGSSATSSISSQPGQLGKQRTKSSSSQIPPASSNLSPVERPYRPQRNWSSTDVNMSTSSSSGPRLSLRTANPRPAAASLISAFSLKRRDSGSKRREKEQQQQQSLQQQHNHHRDHTVNSQSSSTSSSPRQSQSAESAAHAQYVAQERAYLQRIRNNTLKAASVRARSPQSNSKTKSYSPVFDDSEDEIPEIADSDSDNDQEAEATRSGNSGFPLGGSMHGSGNKYKISTSGRPTGALNPAQVTSPSSTNNNTSLLTTLSPSTPVSLNFDSSIPNGFGITDEVHLGGVGTSFDDEYAEMGSSYPFLQDTMSGSSSSMDAHRERREWHFMLKSVLTGEVVKSEKIRLIKNPKAQQQDREFMDEEEFWISLRAKVCGRTVAEQKLVLEYARSSVDEQLNKVLSFKVSEEAQTDLRLAYAEASKVLDSVAEARRFWRTEKTMKEDNKLYGSAKFQNHLDALTSWCNITECTLRELEFLDFFSSEMEYEGKLSTFVTEFVFKQEVLTSLYENRILPVSEMLINKAREATNDYHELFASFALPTFIITGLVPLIKFPMTLIQKIISLRLTYARHVVNPTLIIIDQLLDAFQLFLKMAMLLKKRIALYTVPIAGTGWVFPVMAETRDTSVLIECTTFYLDLINLKIQEGTKSKRGFRSFLESEQMEQQYKFLLDVGQLFEGGDMMVAEKFVLIVSGMMNKLIHYWDGQMRGPSRSSDIPRWFTTTMDNVRGLQRKLLRFYRIMCATYENSIEVAIQTPKLKSIMESLRRTNHVLVYTGSFESNGIYCIACHSIANDQEKLKGLIKGYWQVRDESTNSQITSTVPSTAVSGPLSYILLFCIKDPLVWEGEIIHLSSIGYFDMEIQPGSMRLVSEGRKAELMQTKKELTFVLGINDVFENNESSIVKAHMVEVNHELQKTRRLFFKLSMRVINSAINFRVICKQHDGLQETVQNMFVFSREFGQRGTIVMDVAQRGQIAVKLIKLCLEWVSFIGDDCDPADYKTFRWTVIALEFAMVMMRGVNIMAISNEEFNLLRVKVARCMTLLISHFDIGGARSQAAAKEQKLLEQRRRSKLSTEQIEDDEQLMSVVREESIKKINALEEYRDHLHVRGKVLDHSNTDENYLTLLADSTFSKVNMRWQQGQFIGGGSFGSVYIAVNLDSGQVMAVKEVRLHDAQSIQHTLKIIKDEMTVLEILNHPNIVQYYGVEMHRDKVFIFMEYCEGGSLAGYLETGRIEDESIIQLYTLQMLRGLAYLHKSGIVHRDVKPDNILLDHHGVIKFVDFGAAKAKTTRTRANGVEFGQTKLNSMTGTPMYMSPEVITGSEKGHYGAIDIWSLGCCVLEMATGRRPWANLDNEWAVMYHIAAGQLPQLPSKDQLSEAGHAFLMKCLKKNPAERPTAVELLNDPWIQEIADDYGLGSSTSSTVTSPPIVANDDGTEVMTPTTTEGSDSPLAAKSL